MDLIQAFDVHTIFFTVIGYPMSYIEFYGTIFNLWSVYLVARKNIFTWPVGLIAVVLFGGLFYQIRLYGDFIEQIYYFITCLYGWWVWRYGTANTKELEIKWSSGRATMIWLLVTAAGTAVFWPLIANLHILMPQFFPEATTYPGIDAFTTVASFVAMILMAHKRIECWIYWLVVDVIAVWLYSVKGVGFVSMLYGIFIVLALLGLYGWLKERRLPAAAVLPQAG